MEPWLVSLIMFGGLLLLLAMGMPIALSLGLMGVIAFTFIIGGDTLFQLASSAYGGISSFTLVAIPLFIFMAEVVMFSELTKDSFDTAYKWLGRLPGGIAIASQAMCAAFAAVTGSSMANAATIGMVAIPEMLRKGYNKRLAVGAIASGGTMGVLIPPSVLFIVFGEITEQSVGRLFFAGLIPGIIEALAYMIYIFVRCKTKPSLAPPIPTTFSWKERFASLWKVWAVLLLALVVLGGIYLGVMTPTEAAGVGASGAILLSIVYRRLTMRRLYGALLRTVRTACFIGFIIVFAKFFTYSLAYLGVPQWIAAGITGLEVNRWVIVSVMMVVILILGCFLDGMGIIVLTVPIFLPIILALGFDPIWYGVIFVMNLEIGCITPPLGVNLYVIKGVSEEYGVTLGDVIRGVIPFLLFCDLPRMALVMAFPILSLWLPSLMFGA